MKAGENTPQLTAAQASEEVRNAGNSAKAAHSARYFKAGKGEYGEGDEFAGVTVPVLRQLARKFRSLPLVEVKKLLRSRIHEERLLALLVLVAQFQKGGLPERTAIFQTYLAHMPYINNWDLIDGSAPQIVGAFLDLYADRRERKLLDRLARSPRLWDRRVAMLSTLHWIKRGEFSDALALAEVLLNDTHDLMHKAVGWMLREIGGRDRDAEEHFLARHYRDMPRTMLRYAIEKFPEALRQAYLKGKV